MKASTTLALALLFGATCGHAADLPETVWQALGRGEPQRVILHFADDDIEEEMRARRALRGHDIDDDAATSRRAERYRARKAATLAQARTDGLMLLREYARLPMSAFEAHDAAALSRLLARPEIAAAFAERLLKPHLAQSLPLIRQPQAAAIGHTGAGTTVAVIDSGVDYTRAEFGSCTAPGVPASCRVVAAIDFFTPSDGPLDEDPRRHGSNVAAIAAAVAPGTRIAALDVFNGPSASSLDIIEAIDWAIANRAAFNIVALNLSLGDGVAHTACTQSNDPFVTPLQQARNAGILAAVSSGNASFTAALESPACAPAAVSVGAVYDANVGGLAWTGCADAATAADKVACFSNSSSALTLLAPGALLAAGGVTLGGTSQAAPHVAGSLAVLRARFPGDTTAAWLGRLTGTGVAVTDARNGLVKPRIDLAAAQGIPPNDAFTAATVLSGTSASTSGTNLNATREAGEPLHAGNGGGASIWYRWSAPAGGQVFLRTHGSSVDTLLAVYAGATFGTLGAIAQNDNDGSPGNTSGLLFQAVAGTEYRFAIDGFNGATGNLALAWSLNGAAAADLGVSASWSPSGVALGAASRLSVTVTNFGPNQATNVRIALPLPAGTGLLAASNGCAESAGEVRCTLGAVGAGTSAVVTLDFSTATAGSANAVVTVSSDLPDPVSGNDTVSAQLLIGSAALQVPLSAWALALLSLVLAIGGSRHLQRAQAQRDRASAGSA